MNKSHSQLDSNEDKEKELIDNELGDFFTFQWVNTPFTDAIFTLGFVTAMRTLLRAPEVFDYLQKRILEHILTRRIPLLEAMGIDAGLICECYSLDSLRLDSFKKIEIPYLKNVISEFKNR